VTGETERSLEGWDPEIGPELPLGRVVDLAFDYRGNVTVVERDGTEVEGYLFNRDTEAPEPFVQLLDRDGGAAVAIPYVRIRTIRFTGRDTAAGLSYAAWLRRKEGDPGRAADGAERA